MVLHTCASPGQYEVEYPPPSIGEGTAMLRDLVLPGILEHLIDELEWMVTNSINIEMSFKSDNQIT